MMSIQKMRLEKNVLAVPFVDKIENFVTSRENVEPVLKNFQQLIAKYRFIETNFQQHVMVLLDRIPEMKKTLKVLRFLQEKSEKKESFNTYFELNNTLYLKAIIPTTDKAGVWLGANVMIEYPIPEAIDFLVSRISNAEASLKEYEEDLEFIRDNITILEVNISRIYNWDIAQKRIEKSLGIEKNLPRQYSLNRYINPLNNSFSLISGNELSNKTIDCDKYVE
ncbi:hypothetical protein PORY_002238 [Pneumocystis oryctolagi]|uniref:Uncharacterized protein n=1 Tax=Pneumocystis oryctolagi TaxID=42067 RepID=A0ACB7CBE9_9ASCO|nr:hypothetical protein PORY_002238 [Pneumocystis oryctolagi]